MLGKWKLMNGRTHSHRHERQIVDCSVWVGSKGAEEGSEEWAANETLEAEVDALHLTRPEGNTLQTHLANAGANRQRATSVKHGVYVIFDREIESWTSNRHRLLPLGSSIFVCCQMLLNCHAPNCNEPLRVQCDSTQEIKRETSVFQFTTRMNMNSEYSHQLNSSGSREFILITSSETRVTPGTN